MIGKRFFSKMLCVMLMGCMFLSAGFLVYADSTGGSAGLKAAGEASIGLAGAGYGSLAFHRGFDDVISELVKEGKITEEKAEKIRQYILKKRDEKKQQARNGAKMQSQKPKEGFLEQMVRDGVITREEADAIREKHRSMLAEYRTEKLKGLVEKGVITESELQKIDEYFKKSWEEKQKVREEIKNMTEEQKKAYFQSHKESRKDTIQRMVDDGVINQAQAKELREVLQKHGKKKDCKPQKQEP